MAISRTNLTSGSDQTDTASHATASISPGANRLVLLFVIAVRSGAGTLTTPTVTGNGLTWEEIAKSENGTDVYAGWFRAMGGSPSSGAVTINFGAVATTLVGWSIFEYAGVNTSGSNGSGAIVQAVANNGTGTGSSVTLASFADATNNVCVGGVGLFMFNVTPPGVTPGSGFAEIHDVSINQGFFQTDGVCFTEDKTGEDTGVDASWGTSYDWRSIGLEVAVAPAAANTRRHSLTLTGVG